MPKSMDLSQDAKNLIFPSTSSARHMVKKNNQIMSDGFRHFTVAVQHFRIVSKLPRQPFEAFVKQAVVVPLFFFI